MTNSLFSLNTGIKTIFFAGSILLFLLGFVLYTIFQSSSGIILFLFGVTILTAYLTLITRDNQKYPSLAAPLFEVLLILSVSFPGFAYYYLNSKSQIAQVIIWISVVVVIVACIHTFLILRRMNDESKQGQTAGRILLFCLLAMIVLFGIITFAGARDIQENHNGPAEHDIRYILHTGEQFRYSLQSSESSGNTDSRAVIMVGITEQSGDKISMNIKSSAESQGTITDKSTLLMMTNKGSILESVSEVPGFPEMQRDLPNTIQFPEKPVGLNDTWHIILEKSGNYTSANGNVDYTASGDSRSSYIGKKRISVPAGNFNCIGISNNVNLSITETFRTINGSVTTITKLNATGENWIDSERGFLVRSSYGIGKKYNTDLTEVYKSLGFKALKREIPVKITQVIELDEKH